LDRAADPRREGKRICIEIIEEVRTIKGVSGVHLMAYRQEESVAEIIAESGVLAGRKPYSVADAWRALAPSVALESGR
jgi:hypothetical protein